jgi:hypothetical protein
MPADPRENRSPADGAEAKVGELSAGVRNTVRELDERYRRRSDHRVGCRFFVLKARRKKKSEGG